MSDNYRLYDYDDLNQQNDSLEALTQQWGRFLLEKRKYTDLNNVEQKYLLNLKNNHFTD